MLQSIKWLTSHLLKLTIVINLGALFLGKVKIKMTISYCSPPHHSFPCLDSAIQQLNDNWCEHHKNLLNCLMDNALQPMRKWVLIVIVLVLTTTIPFQRRVLHTIWKPRMHIQSILHPSPFFFCPCLVGYKNLHANLTASLSLN